MVRASGRPSLPTLVGGLFLAGALAAGAPLEAGDVTAFVALAAPTDQWDRGYGAALSSTWFKAIILEGEAARLPGKVPDQGMTSFTASAMLGPPIGNFIPYGGVGVGLFRQTSGASSDIGKIRALTVGAKLLVKGLLVLKAEYRRLDLSGPPLLKMDSRISAGAGIAF